MVGALFFALAAADGPFVAKCRCRSNNELAHDDSAAFIGNRANARFSCQ
jgi:hypothetical protein